MKAKETKKRILKRKKERVLSGNDFVSTGSTMLNLSCTDYPDRGFAKGLYYLIVGTSRSGKTWLSLSCLAEAAINSNFKDYLFIYDNVERGALMDIGRFFGQNVVERLKVVHSYRIEDFYYRLSNVVEKERPFIYVLDSMDGLTSNQEIGTFNKQKDADKKQKDIAGSYGDGKAKVNSQNLRRAITPLEDSGSILIIINQTRDKLTGFGGKTYSGGNALQFYATLEIWSDIICPIKKTYKGKDRLQGNLCSIRVRKNRVTGKDRQIKIPIYNTYGMDDVGSCIDYLTSEKYWSKTKSGVISAPEFEFEGKRSELIHLISEGDMEKDLALAAHTCWKEIENAVAVKRKPRYK